MSNPLHRRVSRRHAPLVRKLLLESDEPPERRESITDFRGSDLEQPFDREALDRKRSHRRAVHDSTPHGVIVDAAGAREVPHESARERIARARGVEHVLQWIRSYGSAAERRYGTGAAFGQTSSTFAVRPPEVEW